MRYFERLASSSKTNARAFLGSSFPSTIINYLLIRLKSPLFYLIKSKSSDQDVRCSTYDKFLHFLTL